MASPIEHEQARDTPSREEYSPVPSSYDVTRNVHTFNDGRPLSQQDNLLPSPMTGNGLSGGEPYTSPEMAEIGPTSVAPLQVTWSDATRSVGSLNGQERSEQVGKPTATSYSHGYTLASDSEGSTEPHGHSLPSRTTIQRDFAWWTTWFFDIIITIIPLFFLGMTVTQFFLSFRTSPN